MMYILGFIFGIVGYFLYKEYKNSKEKKQIKKDLDHKRFLNTERQNHEIRAEKVLRDLKNYDYGNPQIQKSRRHIESQKWYDNNKKHDDYKSYIGEDISWSYSNNDSESHSSHNTHYETGGGGDFSGGGSSDSWSDSGSSSDYSSSSDSSSSND